MIFHLWLKAMFVYVLENHYLVRSFMKEWKLLGEPVVGTVFLITQAYQAFYLNFQAT